MITLLTTYTAIPTAVRGRIRSYLKGTYNFQGWCASKGLDSRNVKNAELLEYAIAHKHDITVLSMINGISANKQAEAMVNGTLPGVKPIAPRPTSSYVANTGPCDSIDEANAMKALKDEEDRKAFNVEEDARIEAACEEFDKHFGAGADKLADVGIAQMDAATILAPVDQFLSPFVKAEVEKALAPVIAAANKPPVEVEKVVHVAAQPTAPAGALPYATQGNKIELGKLFGFRGKYANMLVTQWDSHGAAPAIDPHFVVDPYVMAMLATSIDDDTNVWQTGPSGSGKTTSPIQLGAYTGRPVVKLTFTRNSHVDDFVGGRGMVNGATVWEDGPLVAAMRRPGTIIVLDEITIAPTGVQALIQGCADEHRSLTLPTGEVVHCAPGVIFVVADNTAGYGDETGLYAGTNQANAALVNRFGTMLRIDYMSVAQEATALHNHTRAPKEACKHVAEFAKRARAMPGMENLVFSLRNMVALTKRVQKGFTAKEAAEVAILNRMPSTERAALETLFTLTWASEFEALVNGAKPEAAKPSKIISEAGQAFNDGVVGR